MGILRWTKFIAVAAAILFNNWLLGIVFNFRLFSTGGSVSEFSASGQPYAWLFRSLDIIAGILMVVTAILVFRARDQHRYWRWLALGLVVLGVANCADAALHLPCAGTVDPTCSAPVHISLRRISLPDHVLSSVTIGLMYLFLPVVSFYYAKLENRRRFGLVSLVSLVITIIFFIFLFAEGLSDNNIIDKISGFSEELQMIAFAWWLIELVPYARTSGTKTKP